MTRSNPRAYQVRAKTREVVDYEHDDTRPGKPLRLLVPGGIVALLCLALEYYVAYAAFLEGTMDAGLGVMLMLGIAPFYIGAVFLFSYGYELYDVPKALRLTAIIVFISVAAVVIVAVLFVLLGGSKSGGSKLSSSSGSSRGKSLAGGIGAFLGGGSRTRSGGGPTFINLGGPILTNTVTREIVHDAPKEIAKPLPFSCTYCGRPYLPSETKFACPSCGAPTPDGLFACHNCGAQYVPAANEFTCPTCLTPTPTDASSAA